jgi:hypothetical protein
MRWALLVDDIRMTRSLLEQGYGHDDLRRLQRAGELIRLRRGAYAFEDKPDQLLEERHRRLVWATAPQLGDGAFSVTGRLRCCTDCPSGQRRWTGSM